MAEPLVVVQLTTVRSRSCTPSLNNFYLPSVAESEDAAASKAAACKGLSVRGGPLGPFLFRCSSSVGERAPHKGVIDGSFPSCTTTRPDLTSYTHVAGIAQRQSNRLLTGRSRFQNSLPAPTDQTPSSEAEQRPYKATVGTSTFPGSTTLHGAAGGIGRRSALRAPCPKGHAGSTPAPRTIFPRRGAVRQRVCLRSARSLGRIQPAGPTHRRFRQPFGHERRPSS